jgi:plastocyanin
MLAAEAPSKVPFYVAGGVLVVWAVIVAVWGIRHADFPGSRVRARLVMLTSAVLVGLTVAMAVATAGEAGKEEPAAAGAAPPATGKTFTIAADPGGQLRYDKTAAAVKTGRVTVNFTNDSSVQHNVTIAQGSKTLGATKTITKSTDSLSISLAPGRYAFFCSVPGHRQAGMQGTLTVE